VQLQHHIKDIRTTRQEGAPSCIPAGVLGGAPFVSPPPACNTGVEITGCDALADVRLDWLALRLPARVVESVSADPRALLDVWGLPSQELQDVGHGFLGWEHCYDLACGGKMAIGGQGGTAYLVLSAKALAYLVSVFRLDWQGWMVYLRDLGAVCRRLDFALDDYQGCITLDRLSEAVSSGAMITRAQGLPRLAGDVGFGGESWTVYVGARCSGTFVRFYNKAAEQGIAGVHWVRAEAEFKNDKADAVFRCWVNSDFSSETAVGLFRSAIDFRVPSGENVTRRPLLEWWAQFVGSACRVAATIAAAVRTVDDVQRWIENQVAASLSLLRRLRGDGAIRRVLWLGDSRQGLRQGAVARASFALGVC
jgi:DNA relaxase NicK